MSPPDPPPVCQPAAVCQQCAAIEAPRRTGPDPMELPRLYTWCRGAAWAFLRTHLNFKMKLFLRNHLQGNGPLCKGLLRALGRWRKPAQSIGSCKVNWGCSCFRGCLWVVRRFWGSSEDLRKYPQMDLVCEHSPSTPGWIANHCLAGGQTIHSQNGN